MDKVELRNRIKNLKEEKNAVIVAHSYQVDEVQEIADLVGDSFELSRFCAECKEDIVVFCGVHFMAESAKILSPQKMILLPEIDAGCPMADMVTKEDLIKMKKKYPEAKVVCYINSSADVKAESDICCTSSNAVNVVKSINAKEIIFVPDKNLGSYVQQFVKDKKIILWDGYCITHHRVQKEEVKKVKQFYPDAKLLVHPECRKEIVEMADFVGSTKMIINHAKEIKDKNIIIGTEMGVLHKLKKDNPDKSFYMLSKSFICPNMKKTTLESVYNSLENNIYNIEISDEIISKAKDSLERMLKVK